MSSEYVIEVSNLGKCYQIYDKPSDRLKQMVFRGRKQYYKEFWALRDVSFKVKKGETVGIIGRNGSGKSTLLQMICGTLSPTSGIVKTKGRVAALLELGSGFNPEFTGRENVFLNATILGLTQDQIESHYEAIIDFADIGDFIDQPVKTYSSGMLMRLAFSVIAHVDADVLIIDEALAVGDAIFTQKCMRFIRSFKEKGTILFVSHDMAAVQNLCDSSIWLMDGNINYIGRSDEVAELYLQFTLQQVYGDDQTLISTTTTTRDSDSQEINKSDVNQLKDLAPLYIFSDNLERANGWKTGAAEIISINITNIDETLRELLVFSGGETVSLGIKAKANKKIDRPILGFILRDRLGQDLFGENTLEFTKREPLNIKPGTFFEAEFFFKLPMLPNGEYSLMASVADGEQYDNVQHHYMHNALTLKVSSSKVRFGLVGIQFENVVMRVIDEI